ncbi:hypothetical protein ASPVEDRAFT_308991 [Aspergillus versicolor CBS 583.65]|uniref:Uncharacterized protein n=1 Tax=Aspergillus versicolor CBS 583.65 TaxID=1036611 RepID=A0A1L9PWQ1_ASPVE|nr:uncharacterized protein ASPVEDRAFT_308991 [Aspergillus versicolor CBS 583.65]OJJ05971.1 hypothetical protein ASPVEDRAFT_308991 [Aspergillus versicolor CBS 583.65]
MAVFIRADTGAHVQGRLPPSSLLRPRSASWLGASSVPHAGEASLKHGIWFTLFCILIDLFFYSGGVNA